MSFGFCSLGHFIKEDLVRDDKEEKKLKALRRRRKREKRKVALEEAEIIRASEEPIVSVSLSSSRKKFGDKSSGRARVKAKDKENKRSYNCQWFRHYARDRTKPKLGGQK